MTYRKLTTEEIDYLFTFVEQRDVKYYDVQMELVDHFATAIEKHWEDNPKLTFDEALRLEHKQFNKYDFNRIIEEKERVLKNKYVRLQWKYVLEYFKLPKVLMTIALTITLFSAFRASENFLKIYVLVCLPPFILIWLYGSIFHKRRYKIKLTSNKELLLYNEYKRIRGLCGATVGLLNLPTSFINMIGKVQVLSFSHLVYVKLSLAIFSVLFTILSIVVIIYMPKRIYEDFTPEFPQFVKS